MNTNDFFQTLDKMFTEGIAPEKIDAFLCESLTKASEEKDYGAYVTIGNEMICFYRSISQYD